MEIMVRRFAIIGLAATVFALGLTAVVERTSRMPHRVHIGSAAPCYHPASLNCAAL